MAAVLPIFESKFYRAIPSGTKSLTIISASENGVVIDSNAAYDGYTDSINIFAECIKFRGTDTQPPALKSTTASTILLSTNKIITEGSASSRATILARGKEGTPNDGGQSGGRAATNGTAGRNIKVWLGAMQSDYSPLALDVKGGDGATTNNLKEPAGTSGAGGTVAFYGLSVWAPVHARLLSFQKEFPLPEEWTKEEELSAPVLDINDERILEALGIGNLVLEIIEDGEKLRSEVAGLFAPLIAGNSLSLIALARTIRRATRRIAEIRDQKDNAQFASCDVSAGRAGPAKLVQGERGLNGAAGEAGSLKITISASSPPLPDFPIVHPLQCQMVLEKAQAYFYFGDSENRKKAQRTLQNLVLKLSVIFERPTAELNSAIAPIIQSREALGIPNSLDVEAALRDIYQKAISLLFRVSRTSVDYYGLLTNWVPRTSNTGFGKEVQKAITSLESIGNKYASYQEAFKAQQLAKTHREDAVALIENTQDSVKANLQELRDTLKNLEYRIQSIALKESIKAKSREINFQIGQLKTEIMTSFKVSPAAIKGALISLAKEPSKETAGKEVGKLLWKGFTTVPNAEGVEVDKSLLLSNLETVSGDLTQKFKDFAEDSSASADGQLNFNVENNKLLLATKEQIEKMCDDFADGSFTERAKRTRNLLREYSALVVGRNTNIVQYNVLLQDIHTAVTKTVKLSDDSATLQRTQFSGGQDISQFQDMIDLFDDLYSFTRARVMKLISFYRRSIYFSTLTNPDLCEIIGLKNDAALSLGHTQLTSMNEKLQAKVFELRELKGSDAPRFPAIYESQDGKFVTLTASQLEELKTNKVCFVKLEAPSAETSQYPDFSGYADIRAYRVRFWLDGLTVKDGFTGGEKDKVLVKVELSHRGDSTFYDVYGKRHEFSHDPIDVSWSYRISASAVPSSGGTETPQAVDSGEIVNYTATGADNTAYSAPSPFATWQIKVKGLDNTFDLSKVTRARFEFFGTSRIFKQDL